MQTGCYPLLLKPVYKDYLWGGRRIPAIFHRDTPAEAICAESWEVSDRREGMSVVVNGAAAGTTLGALARTMGSELTGTRAPAGAFPLLIKLIDAEQTLSVQVHPDDAHATACGGEAKTEMWYLLDAAPGANIYIGLTPGTDAAAFRAALAHGNVEQLLRVEPAMKGKVFFVPGGRVHAIGAGCLLLEIQQNSNTTYRVHDWGRLGHDGRPRPLHVERAMQTIVWQDEAPVTPTPRKRKHCGPNDWWELLRCEHFQLQHGALTAPETVPMDGSTFEVLFPVNGRVSVEANGVGEEIGAGTSCLLPAALGQYRVSPLSPDAELARISLPT